jgi:predicted RNA-binding Zn-ribbon protein involved in translation (DUF1610 family)
MLFGHLAVSGRFVTEEQIAECVDMQEKYRSRGGPVPRLGELLAMKGYMTPDQVRAVLDGQHGRREGLFGEIAVRWRFVTREVLDGALAFQREMDAAGKHRARIGEILVGRGELQAHQVRAILDAQGKRIVHCSSCAARFNVAHFRAGASVQCPKCGAETVMGESRRHVADSSPLDVVNTIWLPKEEAREEGPGNTTTGRSLAIGGYEIVSRLGSDGTGAICKARHLGTGNQVALKIMRPGKKVGQEFLERFVEESRQAVLLDHPNIKRVYEVGSDRGRYFLAEEFIEGRSLKRQLEVLGKLTPTEAVETALQMAEALRYAHGKAIVHGDLRPSSVIIDETGRVRLSGLGVAKDATKNLIHVGGDGSATVPYYMAPEQALDISSTDARSDIYSLGAVLYHMVTGRPPYQGQGSLEVLMRLTQEPLVPPKQIAPELSEDLNTLIVEMLDAEPDSRPREIPVVIERLRKALGRQTVQGAESARLGTARQQDVRTRSIPVRQPSAALPAQVPATVRAASGEKRYARERFSHRQGSSAAVPAMIALVLGAIGAVFLVWYGVTDNAKPAGSAGGQAAIRRPPVGNASVQPPTQSPAAEAFNAARSYADNNRGDDEEIARRFRAVMEKYPESEYSSLAKRSHTEYLASAARTALRRIQDKWTSGGGRARGEFLATQDAVDQWLVQFAAAGEDALAPGRTFKQSLVTERAGFVSSKSQEIGKLIDNSQFEAASAALDVLRMAAGVEGATAVGELSTRIETAEKLFKETQRLAQEEAARRQREEEELRRKNEQAAALEAAFEEARLKVAQSVAGRNLAKAVVDLADAKNALKDNPHAGKLGQMEEALQLYTSFHKSLEAGVAARKKDDRLTLPFGGKPRPVLSIRGSNALIEVGADGARMELPLRSFDRAEVTQLAAAFAADDDAAALMGYAVFCSLIEAAVPANAALAKAEMLGARVGSVRAVIADRLLRTDR